jgi:uncharacterized OB-fold protein
VPETASPTSGQFFEGVKHGTLTGIRCRSCGTLAIPPKEFCGTCHRRAWDTQPLSGEGRVTSFTVIRVPPRTFAGDAPYAIAHVTLSEGVGLLGRLVDIPLDRITVGMPVRFRSGTGQNPAALAFGPA